MRAPRRRSRSRYTEAESSDHRGRHMLSRFVSLIAFPLLVILIVTIIAALLLGVGTALTFVFAVTVWEATIVVMAVAAGAFWLVYAGTVHDYFDGYSDE